MSNPPVEKWYVVSGPREQGPEFDSWEEAREYAVALQKQGRAVEVVARPMNCTCNACCMILEMIGKVERELREELAAADEGANNHASHEHAPIGDYFAPIPGGEVPETFSPFAPIPEDEVPPVAFATIADEISALKVRLENLANIPGGRATREYREAINRLDAARDERAAWFAEIDGEWCPVV